jgi:hypothetical protein
MAKDEDKKKKKKRKSLVTESGEIVIVAETEEPSD